jgi:hypothetical protein
MDHLDLVGRRIPCGRLDDRAVVRRDRHDECGLRDLGGQHGPVDVQVRTVRREAVRDAGQPVHEPAGERRVVREVAMDVIDPLVDHRQRHVSDLWEDPEPAQEEVGAAPRSADHVGERTQVASAPASVAQERELASQDRR